MYNPGKKFRKKEMYVQRIKNITCSDFPSNSLHATVRISLQIIQCQFVHTYSVIYTT